MSASPSYESGLRGHRLEYVRESTVGQVPTDPSFLLFSDNIREVDFEHGASISSQRGLGSPDSQGPFAGTEEGGATITYDLQQKSASGNTLLDGSGDPNDAATDGLQRDSDNRIQNTHLVVDRYEQSDLDAGNTVNGSTSRDTRQYWVAKGGYIDEVTLAGDPGDGQPISVELSYEFEKVRHYQIDQPTSGEGDIELWISSTDSSDTSIDVKIESEGGTTADTVTLDGSDGTTDVQSTETFGDVDAIEPQSELVGNLEVYVDDGTGTAAGDQIAVIYGQDAYDTGEGDLGVPVLDSGSRGSAFSQAYELYHDDEVEQPDGTTIADNFEGTEFTVANSVDGMNRGGTPRRSLSAGTREVTVDVTVWGETEIQTRVSENLRSATGNVRWTMGGGHVQADSADPRDTDPDAFTAEDSKVTTSISFTGQSVTVSA